MLKVKLAMLERSLSNPHIYAVATCRRPRWLDHSIARAYEHCAPPFPGTRAAGVLAR
jgi:hypothetical protein